MSEFENPKSRIEAILQNILGANNELDPPMSRTEAILQNILGGNNILDTPATRTEELLQNILISNNQIKKPLSRTEEILQNLIGVENDIKPPESRVEAILQNILGEDNDLEPPRSRVEELLLEILSEGAMDNFLYSVYSIEGQDQLEISRATASALMSLIQDGKCVVSNGEIKCNNGTLVAPNLADMSESNVVMGKYITNTGGEKISTMNFYC